jgi:hypothetical protein
MIRTNTIKLYSRIKQRYEVLYNEQRIRHDDVIERLCDEFCKEQQVIYRALRIELPESTPYKDPTQTALFADSN